MNNSPKLFLLILCFLCFRLSAHENISEIFPVNSNKTEKTIDSSEMCILYETKKNINKLNHEFNSLTGSIELGLMGNESENRKYYDINSGINLDYGIYPFQLDIKSKVKAVYDNGKFDEKISEIDLSFDYHPNIFGGLMFEGFTYLNGYSNDYMGIDEKYEIGVGLIKNKWKGMTKIGNKKQKAVDTLSIYRFYNKNTLEKCSVKITEVKGGEPGDTTCEFINNLLSLSEDELKEINNKRNNIEKANIKKNSILRYGFLLGITYQIEKISASDTIQIDTLLNKRFEKVRFDTDSRFIFVFRPFFEIHPHSNVVLKAKPYFKIPIFSGSGFKNKFEYGPYKIEEWDYFLDFPVSLTIKMSEHAKLSFEYRFLYDNTPKRKYFEFVDGGGGDILKANQKHHRLEYKFIYNF